MHQRIKAVKYGLTNEIMFQNKKIKQIEDIQYSIPNSLTESLVN